LLRVLWRRSAKRQDAHAQILPASHELFRRGLELHFSRPHKEWSQTDCISFTVMKDEGLTEAFTGDQHFPQAGFTPLLREKAA
jgi:predicted nucleic acid-binding protein